MSFLTRLLTSCPLCTYGRFERLASLVEPRYGTEYDVIRCCACDGIFVNPMPQITGAVLQDVYDKTYFEREGAFGEPAATAPVRLQSMYVSSLKQGAIIEQYVNKGWVLDYGCGTGIFLKALQDRGWQVVGFEPASVAARFAREQHKLAVYESLDQIVALNRSFDLINFCHVIEHLSDPRSTVANLYTLLREGGLLVLHTDNARGLRVWTELGIQRLLGRQVSASLVSRLMRKNINKRYGRLAPPEHLCYFTARAATNLLQIAGFEIVKVIQPAWGNPVWFPDSSPFERGIHPIERFFRVLDFIGERFNRGQVLVILARKSHSSR